MGLDEAVSCHQAKNISEYKHSSGSGADGGAIQRGSDERWPSLCAPRLGGGRSMVSEAGRGTQTLLFELLGGLPQVREPASVWLFWAGTGARARLLASQGLPAAPRRSRALRAW